MDGINDVCFFCFISSFLLQQSVIELESNKFPKRETVWSHRPRNGKFYHPIEHYIKPGSSADLALVPKVLFAMDVFRSGSCSDGVGAAENLFLLLLQTLYYHQCSLNDYVPRDYFPERSYSNEYDFIVIGGGSTGSVVASRLSKNKHTRVLLIEGGGDPPVESSVSS